ncbi:MAG: LysR family transcriptional regulator, partial [Akkermansiaceae bacterium]|nr:LysR family transcriptional regulator [Akkermansiaceae bacterium]
MAAAEEMSMSRAAERVHVSQPALSRQIALLEEEIGVLLFDRIRKRIHLTEAGGFFLTKARQLLCDAESGIQQVREQFGGE